MTPNDLLRAIKNHFSFSILELAELYSVSEDTIKSYLKIRNPKSAKLIFEDPSTTRKIIESHSGTYSTFDVLSGILSQLSEGNKELTHPLLNESIDLSIAVSILCKAALLPVEEQKQYIERRCAGALLNLEIDELEAKLYTADEAEYTIITDKDVDRKYFTAILDSGFQQTFELLLSFRFNDNGQEYILYRDPNEPCAEDGRQDILISHVYRNGNQISLHDATDSEYRRILNLIKELALDIFESSEPKYEQSDTTKPCILQSCEQTNRQHIILTNQKGNQQKFELLHTLHLDETEDDYIVYKEPNAIYDELGEAGEINLFVSRVHRNGNNTEIHDVTDAEYNAIRNLLNLHKNGSQEENNTVKKYGDDKDPSFLLTFGQNDRKYVTLTDKDGNQQVFWPLHIFELDGTGSEYIICKDTNAICDELGEAGSIGIFIFRLHRTGINTEVFEITSAEYVEILKYLKSIRLFL